MQNRLREFRKRAGLTLEQVGEILGLSSATVSRHETSGTASVDQLIAYAGVYGCDPAGFLLTDEPKGLAESEARYLPEKRAQTHQLALAGLLYERNTDTWIVGARSLERVGIVPGHRILVDPKRKPTAGEPVLVQLSDEERDFHRTILRVYDPPFLMPASVDTGFAPLLIDPPAPTPKPKIRGVIVGSYWRADDDAAEQDGVVAA